MKKVKGFYLEMNEICEYAESCFMCVKCLGKEKERQYRFSCAMRRGLLIAENYEIKFNITKEA